MVLHYDIGLERAILATAMSHENLFAQIASELTPQDFGYLPHQDIYRTMLSLNARRIPLTEEMIKANLQSKNPQIENDIVEIIVTTPLVEIDFYIKEIKQLSVKRNVTLMATTLLNKLQDKNVSATELLEIIEKDAFKINCTATTQEMRDTENVLTPMVKMLETLKADGGKTLRGLDTSFHTLNKITTGFNGGELIIVAARPSVGKTAIALNMIMPTLAQGDGVAFFSLEMSAEQLMMRIIASKHNIHLQRLKTGDLLDEEMELIKRERDELSKKWKLFIDDSGAVNITKVRSRLRELIFKRHNIKLAVIDYIQIMQGNGRERHLEIAEITRGLKILARELNIPIIALSQLNRQTENRTNKRPMLSDLRESGTIEQDADIVLMLYRASIYKQYEEREKAERAQKEGKEYIPQNIIEKEIDDAELIIAKHRNGALGVIDLNYHAPYTKFIESNSDFSFTNSATTSASEGKELVENFDFVDIF